MSWQGHDFDFTGARFDSGGFSGAKFTDGKVNFAQAKFTDGGGVFAIAEFGGSEVGFPFAEFTDGEVDLKAVFPWGIPPSFDEAVLASPPAGLRLPATATAPQPGETSGR